MTPAGARPTTASANLRAVEAHNRRRTLVLLAVVLVGAVVVGGTVGLVGGSAVAGAFGGLVLAGAGSAVALTRVVPVLVALTGARRADAGRHARLLNLTEGLCLAAGAPQPDVYVVDDGGLNAFTVGLGPGRTALAVTEGLVEGLGRIELEAVVARQLALVRSGETRRATVALALVGRPAMALLRLLPHALRESLARGLRRVLCSTQDPEADLAGVRLTRYPPGLIEALGKVAGAAAVRSAPTWSSPLWFAEPAPGMPGPGGIPSDLPPLQCHRPIDERIEALKEL